MVGLETCVQGAAQGVVLPYGSPIYTGSSLITDPSQINSINSICDICASDDNMRATITQGLAEIDRMIEQARISEDGSIILLFCRDVDDLINVPLFGLRDMIENLARTKFKDEKKTRNFFRLKRALEELGHDYKVFTSFDEALQSVAIPEESEGFYDDQRETMQYKPVTFVIFKLFQFNSEFDNRTLSERMNLILKKNAIDKTVLEYLSPLKERIQRFGSSSRIVVYGPKTDLKDYKRYDFQRARLEKAIFEEARRYYGNDPVFEFIDNKNLVSLFRYLRGGQLN